MEMMETTEIKDFQGKFQIPIYTVNTIGNSLPATPTGGSYSGGTLTVPTSAGFTWSESIPSYDSTTEEIVQSITTYDPANPSAVLNMGNTLFSWSTRTNRDHKDLREMMEQIPQFLVPQGPHGVHKARMVTKARSCDNKDQTETCRTSR